MTRAQLEHIVRAASAITDESVILVLGSQSILGSFPTASSPFDLSREADVCPLPEPEQRERAGQIYTVVQSKTSGDRRRVASQRERSASPNDNVPP